MRKTLLIGSLLFSLAAAADSVRPLEAAPWKKSKASGSKAADKSAAQTSTSTAKPMKPAQIGVVSVAVADVRKTSGTLPQSLEYDADQETQLLYGEIINIVEESGDWVRIEAIEQEEFSHNQRWQGYPGWVKKTCVMPIKVPERNFVVQKKATTLFGKPRIEKPIIVLSMGTELYATDQLKNGYRKVRLVIGSSAWVPNADVRSIKHESEESWERSKIVEAASELMGDPYFWGGRAAHIPEIKPQMSAVDCSGLTHLAYRVAGKRIPRDSLEQFMKAKKIKKEALKMGDLIFVASREKPDKISHVAIYIQGDTMIEAPRTGEFVHKITFQEKFGVPLEQITDGEPAGDRMIYFGSYF